MECTKYAAAHLDLRLAVLNRACRAALGRQMDEAMLLDRPDLADRCITDRQVEVLMERADRFALASRESAPSGFLTDADRAAEHELRVLAGEAGIGLPLDILSEHYGLDELDRQSLVAVAAAELDRAYERIYGYLCDEFERRYPSVELLLYVTEGIRDRYTQRMALGPLGPLRRNGLLLPHGDAQTELRQQLRVGPGVLELLLGAALDVGALGSDPNNVIVDRWAFGVGSEPHDLARLAGAIRVGAVDSVCVWCPRADLADAGVVALATSLGRGLRRLPPLVGLDPGRAHSQVRQSLNEAAAYEALLWIPLSRADLDEPGMLDTVASALASTRHPVLVSATAPWRPAAVLAARRWVEVQATEDGTAGRAAHWRARYPQIPIERLDDIAARFQLSPLATTAVDHLTGTESATLNTPVGTDALTRACAAMSAPAADQLMRVVVPSRGSDDLVLTTQLHRQVLEIAAHARAIPMLEARWRDNELLASQRGYKVLFTGEPGTGKTVAAEVIASLLGVQLIKVDLSRVVSKWVGETAKHLDDVFHLTSASSAVLFFDEADALFGKRGEVHHGTDRYANTEVSHLLQRFEEYAGLVILASNLRDNIDPAFSRRFHAVLHFPRPEEPERRRLWELAIRRPEGHCGDIDLDLLATLDITGAGIVGAVRTAALIAAAARQDPLSMNHIVQGVAGQYRSEGRLFPSNDLAPHSQTSTAAP